MRYVVGKQTEPYRVSGSPTVIVDRLAYPPLSQWSPPQLPYSCEYSSDIRQLAYRMLGDGHPLNPASQAQAAARCGPWGPLVWPPQKWGHYPNPPKKKVLENLDTFLWIL